MQVNTIGWDIGGAHVKAAVLNKNGCCIAVYQQPCQLWKGIDQLHNAVGTILNDTHVEDVVHAITMTGELVDLFKDRDEGVSHIISAMCALLPTNDILIFAGQEGFVESSKIMPRHYEAIASANWLASASFAAQQISSGLFVDIGSTTTDILLLFNNQVLAEGVSDYQRLISQELVYTGIVRTAVMAVAQTALDKGQEIGLMAEYFATMADVYRITGELNESHDQTDTADGAEKSVFASATRLARMVGCDFSQEELPRWQQFAQDLRTQQLQKIQRACQRRISCQGLPIKSPLIGAGVGRFLVKHLALVLGHPYVDFSDLLEEPILSRTGMTIADCAPAVAVASLARQCAHHRNH